MHIKRKTIGNFWPVPRTGTKYMAVPSHEENNSLSLILVIRDVLKLVKTKKELKKILNDKQIMVNGRIVRETNYPLMLYDSLNLPSIKKSYKIVLNGKRFDAKEVSENESNSKIYKILNKRLIAGKKVQINLSHGKNILTSEKLETGDFVLLNHKDNKILKIIPVKKDAEVIVIAGKHMGKNGKIKDIVAQGNEKVAIIKTNLGEINANIKNIFIKE